MGVTSQPPPRDGSLESTLALLTEGYEFIARRAQRLDTQAFTSRLVLTDVVCVTGAAAAREFYDASLFERGGVPPERIRHTLLGDGGVHTLDGAAHRHRKAAIMAMMTPARIGELLDIAGHQWQMAADRWQAAPQIELLEESQRVFCRAACTWAGVPLASFEAAARERDLAAMVDAFGAFGWRHWRGRAARARSQLWIGSMIERVRNRSLAPPADSLIATWAWHRDHAGRLLPARVAATEVLNLIRPVVAVSYFVAFLAHALIKHPGYRLRLRAGEGGLDELFVHEVRRFYPFAPFVGARTRIAFDSVTGYRLPQGQLVLFDIFGTNRDAVIYAEPRRFWPERFAERAIGAFDYVPQGGGEVRSGHRCAGEDVTIALLRQVVHLLTRCLAYEVPPQDLSYSLARMPSRPRSGVILGDVRQLAAVDERGMRTTEDATRRRRVGQPR